MNTESKKGTVFIVEDDKLLSLVEERLLVKLGFQVVDKAESGEEAIQKLNSIHPDFILMDISLNGELDGIETIKKIREFSDIPVIYLSGNSDKYNYERAKSTGFVDYLVKPVTADDLVGPVNKAVALARGEKEDSIKSASTMTAVAKRSYFDLSGTQRTVRKSG